MIVIEGENPRLKGVLPKNYARPGLDKQRLGELIDLIGTIGLGEQENRSKDILGRGLRILPLTIRECGGQKGRSILHPPLCGASAR